MDASVVRLRHPGLLMVSTTDFFYPLVEDPYLQGRIACCNVLSDLFAMGVSECDTMLMILAVSMQMQPRERDVATTLMMKGFNDCAEEAGTSVTGGQTVLNPWPIIGGTATAVVPEGSIVRPNGIRAGHVIVLTKPLGTQIAVNLQQWRRQPKHWARVSSVITEDAAERMYTAAARSMAHLSQTAASLMQAHGATGATDVTGFGPLGHLQNLAEHANDGREPHGRVRVVLEQLPVLEGCLEADDALGGMFGLRRGVSAETSGGLMVALPEDRVDAFVAEMAEKDELGWPVWRVGRVEALREEGEEGEVAGTAGVCAACADSGAELGILSASDADAAGIAATATAGGMPLVRFGKGFAFLPVSLTPTTGV